MALQHKYGSLLCPMPSALQPPCAAARSALHVLPSQMPNGAAAGTCTHLVALLQAVVRSTRLCQLCSHRIHFICMHYAAEGGRGLEQGRDDGCAVACPKLNQVGGRVWPG